MSRIGKLPIALPAKVELSVSKDKIVTVKGPKGTLAQQLTDDIGVSVEDGKINVSRPSEQKKHRALHGLYRALINNMVEGVSKGFSSKMELVGVGYKIEAKEGRVLLTLGYSHPIEFHLPTEVKWETQTIKGQAPYIVLNSIDKQLLGAVCAKIRSLRAPEPYKGKGIKFAGEVLRRKAGKTSGKKK